MQRVLVVPHDPAWAAEFARESAAVSTALGDLLVSLHHIGSTAIPGIHAKPVIDMMAVVRSVAGLDRHDGPIRLLGYEAMGEFGIPGRRYFRKDDAAGDRTHQVHAFEEGSAHVARHLAFRDFLRAHPEHAARYSALKQRLAALYPTDIAAYCAGKDDFIRRADEDAAAWRAARPECAPRRPGDA